MNPLPSLWRNIVLDRSRLATAFDYAWSRPLITTASLAVVVLFIGWVVSTGGTGFTFQADGKQHARTLWEWLGLLLVPLVLASGGVVFNLILIRRAESEATTDREIAEDRTNTDRAIAEERIETDRVIAEERSREQNLRNFINIIQDLVITPGSDLDSDERLQQVARAQAIATVKTLDSRRLEQIITFLAETGLLDYAEDDDEFNDAISADGDETETASSASDRVSNDTETAGSAITFEGADFRDVNWPGANLRRMSLSYVRLAGSDLSDAFMEHAILRDAFLQRVNFERADLSHADLTDAELDRACLREANLEDAVLNGASLEDADFEAADLIGAQFKNAILTGANFENAVDLTAEQINEAVSIFSVVLPDGTKVPGEDEDPKRSGYVVRQTDDGWEVE